MIFVLLQKRFSRFVSCGSDDEYTNGIDLRSFSPPETKCATTTTRTLGELILDSIDSASRVTTSVVSCTNSALTPRN